MKKDLKEWIKEQKPTIYDIKRYTLDSGPYFFSRDTMKFFKQTLKDFRITKLSFNKWYILAKSGAHWTERTFSFTNFNQGELRHVL